METAVRAVQTLTIQLSRPMLQQIVDDHVRGNGYFAETICQRLGCESKFECEMIHVYT